MNSYYDVFGNFVPNYVPVKDEKVKQVENFSDASADVKQAVKDVYQADVEAIRNLSNVATKLQKEGLTMPGHLAVSGRASVGTPDTPANFHEWLSLSVNNNTDTHIRLKTKNDDNKNAYLINRDGHFRVHTTGYGDMMGLNRDGHFFTEHIGDNVVHHVGRGGNPYITLSRAGQWDNSSWYLQNVYNTDTKDNKGNVITAAGNSFFRINKHAQGAKLDIHNGGTVNHTKLSVGGDINTYDDKVGMLNIKNRDGRWTHFDWGYDNKNYIRGDTQQDGNLNVNGNIQVSGSALIHTKVVTIPINNEYHNTGVDHTNWNLISMSPLNQPGFSYWEVNDYQIGKINGYWHILVRNAKFVVLPKNIQILVTFARTNICSTENYF